LCAIFLCVTRSYLCGIQKTSWFHLELKKDYVEQLVHRLFNTSWTKLMKCYDNSTATSRATWPIMVELILVLVVVWHKLVEWELVVVKEVGLYRTSF
jgi:hypothetical protein